ncbi:MAG TPA: prepilin-type N-terminal cleavage/methylation domain-containing protein [Sulfurovum sp.]|uniref:prepilin-type N-terminal cleavage/methylation domain-containing protein n=1 Tax=Sulfurovum sp. TaxID=1969726 RepID=UPI002F928BB9
MQTPSKKAFTMIELIFVIVVIGILAAIAVPKLAATRDDATITKAIATIGSVRSALATERQKRILRGDFTAITSLNNGGTGAFTNFSDDSDGNANPVLEYAVPACSNGQTGCWSVEGTTYTYHMPTSGTVEFTLDSNRFDCDAEDSNCRLLTQ